MKKKQTKDATNGKDTKKAKKGSVDYKALGKGAGEIGLAVAAAVLAGVAISKAVKKREGKFDVKGLVDKIKNIKSLKDLKNIKGL